MSKVDWKALKTTTQCDGKVGIPNAKLAQQVARRQNQQHKGARLEAYHCKHCGLWHTGGTAKPKKPLVDK